MSAAYDRLAAGYYNANLFSPANPGGLSGKEAVRTNWTPMLLDFTTVAGEVATALAQAEAAAASAINAPGTKATSATEFTLPAEDALPIDIVITLLEPDKLFGKGQTIVVSADEDATCQASGPIKAFDPVTKIMTFQAKFVAGAGTFDLWNVALSAPIDGTLTGRVAALEEAADQQRDRARFFAKELI